MFGILNIKKVALPAAVVASGLIATATGASAATFAGCTGDAVGPAWDVSTKISGATDCTWRTDADQDFVGNNAPLTVNEGSGFFGATDWTFAGKISQSFGLGGNGDGQTGTYDFTDPDLVGKTVLAVFKSGKVGGVGLGLVGYILGADSGTWATPFIPDAVKEVFDVDMNNPKRNSHVSIYYRDSGPIGAVPVPAALPLMLTVIGAGAFVARRRRKQA